MTELVFILDRSGSMSGLETDTIGGFNSMLEYSARDCAPQPLKLSIHSGGIEHPCRCR